MSTQSPPVRAPIGEPPAAVSRHNPDKPRVALVAHGVHDHGGMERALAQLVRRARGEVEFVVLSPTLADDLRRDVEWIRVRTPARPYVLRFLVFFLAAGLRLRTIDADIRHSEGAIVPNRVDVATVQFCHAGYVAATGRLAPPGAPLARRVNTALSRIVSILAERWSYRRDRLAAFAAASADIGRELAAHYPRVPVVVTPNGADTRRFRPDPRARARVRDACGASDADVIVLFVGGDWDRKGLGVAIAALAEAAPEAAELVLWVVGRGDEQRFKQQARDLGVLGRVRFFGFRDDTEQFFQAADIFVLPTLYEAHPLSPHEAAASGLPVVVTHVNGVTELVGDDEAGILVERSPAAVGAALARLANDPALRERQATRARERGAAFTWRRGSDALLDLYRSLAASESA
jgi:UDP-glucose:(heptosyl)LPS alpha-1,3-glucosyltransferase